MSYLSEVSVKVDLDTSGVEKGLSDVKKSTDGIKSTLMNVGKVVAGAFAVDKIVEFGKKAIESASEVEEMENKFNVVFKTTGKEVDAWASKLGNAIGRNKNDIKGAVSNVGDLLTGFGMTEKSAGSLAESVIGLSYDLASFNNLSDEDALDAMTAGLLGEHDAVKKLGIVLNDATLAEAMHKMSISGKFQDLDEATKAQVRYTAMISQTKNAQGDAERSAGGYANSLKRLQANVQGIYEAIGKLMLPVATAVVKVLADGATSVSNFIGALSSGNASGLANALAPLQPILNAIITQAQPFISLISQMATEFANTAFTDFKWIIQGISDVFNAFMPIATTVAGVVTNILGKGCIVLFDVLTNVWSVVNLVVQVFLQIYTSILQNCAPAIALLGNAFMSLASLIIQFYFSYMQPVISQFIEIIYALWADNADTLNMIGEAWGVAMNTIAGLVQWLIGVVKSYVMPFLTWLVGIISSNLDNIHTVMQGAFDVLKGVLDIFIGVFTGNWSKVWSGVKEICSGAWEMITGGFRTLVSVIGSVLSPIGNILWSPFSWAGDKISGFVNNIRSWFSNLFPHIKLPHFTFTGSLNPATWATGGLPKLGVEWYATGGIATGASIVGVGEAGDEAIVPLSNKSRMRPFAEAVADMITNDNDPKSESADGGVNIHVESLVVREEADIKRIAEELYRLQQRNLRAKGGYSYGY